jgi:hypothetical protein
MRPLARFQPTPGTADFENLLFLGEGAEDTGKPADINETARVEWIAVNSIRAGTQLGLLHVLAFHGRLAQ